MPVHIKQMVRRGATVVTSALLPILLWSPLVRAEESKWTIENKFTAQEVEAPVSRDAFSTIDEFEISRLIAEGLLKSNSDESRRLLESSVRGLKKYGKSETRGLQSAQIALCQAYLNSGKRQKAFALLRTILEQHVRLDRSDEYKYRKKLSNNELLEPGIETETHFETRYSALFKSINTNPLSLVGREAKRLLWDRRLVDALRITEIGMELLSDVKSTDSSLDVATKADLVFTQSLIHFEIGQQSELMECKKLLEELTVGLKAHASELRGLEGTSARETSSGSETQSQIIYESRLTFLNGLIADLGFKDTNAQKFYDTAIDAVKKTTDRQEILLYHYYLGKSLVSSGNPVLGYDELNHVFEEARRSIEGRENGLDFIGLGRASLDGMYKCVLLRASNALARRVNRPESFSVETERQFNVDSFDSGCCFSSDGTESSVNENSVSTPYAEDYQRLAEALYHVAYQNKVTGNQPRARQCFWFSAKIYEEFLPQNRRQLAGVLYDLAESFSWSEAPDVGAAIMLRCAELREQIDPNSVDYIMTLNTLGRIYLANREPKKATRAFRSALHLYIERQDKQAHRVALLVDGLKSRSKLDGVIAQNSPAQIDSLPLETQLAVALKSSISADYEVRAQIEDLWQVLADSYSRDKNYDQAKQASRALLEMRRASKSASKEELLGSIWQLAYICGVSNSLEDAERFYSEMIEKYSKGPGKPLADWYYHRGVVSDSIGHVESAKGDFKRAIIEYKNHIKTLDKIDDRETIEQLGWLIADLRLELKAKARCPEDSPDYFHSYPHYYWRADRFPLKIYIDDTETRGFGPSLYGYMRKAVDEWSRTPGMRDKFVFVDDREKADIYFERMSTYDLIPFGSGGGATASFVKKGKRLTKEIDRVHLRLYCRERDSEGLSRHAVDQLYTLALHEFGHGLGLGHSPSGSDVMYWKSAMYKLSGRDRSTLLKIYGFQEESLTD